MGLAETAPLGLPHEALRWWAVALLAACGVATVIMAFAGGRMASRRSRLPVWLPVTVVALLVRGLLSVVQDGGVFDVLVSYRAIGEHILHGTAIWTGPTDSLATYPPTIYGWWATAALVPADHPHVFAAVVRAPFWIIDAAIAPLLLRVVKGHRGVRAAWMYALCPVAIAVPTLHGQFDPIVAALLLVAGVSLLQTRVAVSGLVAGVGVALKQWPVFFLVPLLAALPRRRIPGFAAAVALPILLSFAGYAIVHPTDAVRGMAFIARYSPHRQGLGTSLFFPNDVPAGAIIVTNVTATVVAGALAAIAVRNGRSIAEAMALDMLLLLGLSPTVSDQYLMWAFPFLLVAGRLRTASLLSLGLLPAVVSLDLWTSQGDGATPRALLLLATASLLLGAASLLRRPGAGQRRQEQLKPVTERAA